MASAETCRSHRSSMRWPCIQQQRPTDSIAHGRLILDLATLVVLEPPWPEKKTRDQANGKWCVDMRRARRRLISKRHRVRTALPPHWTPSGHTLLIFTSRGSHQLIRTRRACWLHGRALS